MHSNELNRGNIAEVRPDATVMERYCSGRLPPAWIPFLADDIIFILQSWLQKRSVPFTEARKESLPDLAKGLAPEQVFNWSMSAY